MTDSQPPPADDFPAVTWLQVRILPGGPPRAIRMRQWLKRGLRDYGIKVVAMPDELPEDVSTLTQSGDRQ